MLDKFKKGIESKGLIVLNDRLLLALSGGVDSMTLADLLLKSGYSFEIAHMNYQLRGEDSDKDEKLVRDWASKNKITSHIRRSDPNEFPEGQSIQMGAREIRYNWFERVLSERKLTHIVTAHHADDNLETILFNLTKGTGIRGLLGIRSRKHNRIRPLLSFTKDEIRVYARQNKLVWREDNTNQKSDYYRNKIRHQVLPVLCEINPSVVASLGMTVERLEGVEQLMEDRLQEIKANHLSNTNGKLGIDTSWLEPDRKSLVLLSELIKEFGISYATSRQIHHCIQEGETGRLFYSSTHVINLDRGTLLIGKQADSENILLEVAEDSTYISLPFFDLSIDFVKPPGVVKGPTEVALLDRSKLHFPLKLRRWKDGDWFYPLGMSGHKRISDLLVDNKISLIDKKDVWILESAGDICWVVGIRIDDRFKISSSTKEVVRLEQIRT